MKKKLLIISNCSTRGKTGGLTSFFIDSLRLNDDLIEINLLDTSFFKSHSKDVYHADNYYGMPESLFVKFLMLFPFIRRWFRAVIVCRVFNKLLNENFFDLVIVYEIQKYTDKLVEISHKHDMQIMLYPFGSDVLRAKGSKKKHHKISFSKADFVTGYKGSCAFEYAINSFEIPQDKIFAFDLGMKSISSIIELENTKTREEMHKELGIDISSLNIVCGYNGVVAQRHKEIIQSIVKIKSYLPKDFQLLFPVTYGEGYKNFDELKTMCRDNGLKFVFFEKYLTNEQLVYLHFITDLFINVQPTDNGNAFLIEALACGNKIVCGRWLKYKQFEKYGIPFYQCNSLVELPNTIVSAIDAKESIVPQELKNDLRMCTTELYRSQWRHFIINNI